MVECYSSLPALQPSQAGYELAGVSGGQKEDLQENYCMASEFAKGGAV